MNKILNTYKARALEEGEGIEVNKQVKLIQSLFDSKKEEVSSAFDKCKGITLRVYFGATGQKMYTYREDTFKTKMKNFARISRILIAAMDENNRVIALIPFVDFTDGE